MAHTELGLSKHCAIEDRLHACAVIFELGLELTGGQKPGEAAGNGEWLRGPQVPQQEDTLENVHGNVRKWLLRKLDSTTITNGHLKMQSLSPKEFASPREREN